MKRARLTSLALSLVAAPSVAQSPATPSVAAYVKPLPPGELVDIGGRRLHIECKGTATAPTVVIEAGLSQYTAHSTYGKAQDLIAEFARVCIYDRAGLGWSDPVTGSRTQTDMIEDLHSLLRAKAIAVPVVLVGHSVGGLLVRLYAKEYPDDVAAVVLVDASNEAINFGPGAAERRAATRAQIVAGLRDAKEGVPIVPLPAGTPADAMMAFTPAILRAVRQEYDALDLVPDQLRQPGGYGTLGDKPLAVIRRGRAASPPNDLDEAWRRAQESMTSLSSRSFLTVAANSGHVIPYDEPQVVADAVERVLFMLDDNP